MSARAEYKRMYRASDPERREGDNNRNRERRAALELLRQRHQEEFERILSEIRSATPRRQPGRPRTKGVKP